MQPVCPITGKRQYKTEAGALNANLDKPKAIAYRCSHCHDFHITRDSRDKRRLRKRARARDARNSPDVSGSDASGNDRGEG
jgi:hypothetical protein